MFVGCYGCVDGVVVVEGVYIVVRWRGETALFVHGTRRVGGGHGKASTLR